jgi:hypothetical protein
VIVGDHLDIADTDLHRQQEYWSQPNHEKKLHALLLWLRKATVSFVSGSPALLNGNASNRMRMSIVSDPKVGNP